MGPLEYNHGMPQLSTNSYLIRVPCTRLGHPMGHILKVHMNEHTLLNNIMKQIVDQLEYIDTLLCWEFD